MSILDNQIDLGAESGEDLQTSQAALIARLDALRERIRETDEGATKIGLCLDEAALLLELEREDEAHAISHRLLQVGLHAHNWEQAVAACDLIFRCAKDDALNILGQGVWLAVSFPIEPELSVAMLQHIIDDTPDNADGAAVAAATAAYIVDLRCSDKARNDLGFFTTQMLGDVARRHSDIQNQQQFESWVRRLELDDPDKFLGRLRNVIDVLVQDEWLYDRDLLRNEIPQH
jgi:hypothetical protein